MVGPALFRASRMHGIVKAIAIPSMARRRSAVESNVVKKPIAACKILPVSADAVERVPMGATGTIVDVSKHGYIVEFVKSVHAVAAAFHEKIEPVKEIN